MFGVILSSKLDSKNRVIATLLAPQILHKSSDSICRFVLCLLR